MSCAPAPAGTTSAPASQPAATVPKIIRIAMGREPSPGLVLFDQQGGTGSYWNAVVYHSGLTFFDGEGNADPIRKVGGDVNRGAAEA